MAFSPYECVSLNRSMCMIIGVAVVAGLAGCDPGVRTEAMVVTLAPGQVNVDAMPIRRSITVGNVTGGMPTVPLIPVSVTNDNFRAALQQSLAGAELAGANGSRFTLNAELISLDYPVHMWDITVRSTVKYMLLSADSLVPVWTATVITPFSVPMAEERDGTRATYLAQQGAMHANILELLQRLTADARPGGPLGPSK